MALTRPPDVPCGSFAALGPQLQTLARAVDAEMCDMSSAVILTGLDAPTFLGTHPGGVSVPGNGVDYSFGLSYTPTFLNTDPITGPIGVVGGSQMPFLQRQPEQGWWYLGFWIHAQASPAVSTRWKVRFKYEDIDPSSGLRTTTYLYRHWRNNFAGAVGGDELFHLDFLFPSAGGFMSLDLKQNSGGNLNTNGGRIWLTRLSTAR